MSGSSPARAFEKRLTAQGHFVINPHRISELFGTAEEIAGSFRSMYAIEDLKFSIADYPVSPKRSRDMVLASSIMSADLAAVRSCDAISERLGGIAVETGFNGVEMLYHRQPRAYWQEEYHRSVYGKTKKGEAK